jgi:hypothetical protein
MTFMTRARALHSKAKRVSIIPPVDVLLGLDHRLPGEPEALATRPAIEQRVLPAYFFRRKRGFK